MIEAKAWMQLAVVPALIAGCIPNSDSNVERSNQFFTSTPRANVSQEGILDFGTVVFAENPTTLLEFGDLHGYEFDGKKGGVVTITMKSASCGAPDTVLALFGPEDNN